MFRTNCSVHLMDWIVVCLYGHLPVQMVQLTEVRDGCKRPLPSLLSLQLPDTYRTLNKVSLAQNELHHVLPTCIASQRTNHHRAACVRSLTRSFRAPTASSNATCVHVADTPKLVRWGMAIGNGDGNGEAVGVAVGDQRLGWHKDPLVW